MIDQTVRHDHARPALPIAPMAMPDQQLERARATPIWRVVMMPWLVWK